MRLWDPDDSGPRERWNPTRAFVTVVLCYAAVVVFVQIAMAVLR